MRIIDSRTKEGIEELEIKRLFNKLIDSILVCNCVNKPGEFIKKYGKNIELSKLKSKYVNDVIIE